MLRLGIVGAGLIGTKRSNALGDKGKVLAIADVQADRADKLASLTGAQVEKSWETLIQRPDIDAVVVATTNDVIPTVSTAALRAGKHVLLEKPGGRNATEVRAIRDAEKESGKVVGVGFNHRFHPGLLQAKEIVDSGVDGPVMYIRARYGHGGRLGYEKEWRANPKIAGGGELLDQGVHLIDLSRWIAGELNLRSGYSGTFFWDMPVEDNGFMLLEGASASGSKSHKPMAFLHASCTEWKNLFDFEIFCRNAKIEIFGLGGSYGVEELRYFKMKPEMGPPDIKVSTFPGPDESWELEYQAFLDRIAGKKTPLESTLGTLTDAIRAVEIVQEVYRQ